MVATLLVAWLGFASHPLAGAQSGDDPKATLFFDREAAPAGDELRDLDDWTIQHISVSGMAEVERMIDDRRDRLPSTIALSVGRNDNADLDAFRSGVTSIVEALDGTDRVLWLDLPEERDRDRDANRILREIARANPALRVLAWNGAQRSIRAYDSRTGELTADGSAAMTSLIASELRGRSVGLASGPLLQTNPTGSSSTTTTRAPTTTSTSTTSTSTTTTTAPPTTTTTAPTTTTAAENPTDDESGPTSSTYLTTTTTIPSTTEPRPSTSLDTAPASTAPIDTSSSSPPTTATQTTGDELAVGVGDATGGRGLRQTMALLFSVAVAGVFVAVRRNEIEPFDGRSRQRR